MLTNLYVIGTVNGPKKVGLSRDPAKRCAALNNAGLRQMTVLHALPIETRLAIRAERHAHWLLRAGLAKGEWFRVTTAEAKAAIQAAALCGGQGEQAKPHVGRKKEFEKRITLPLSAETLARIDAVLSGEEPRLDMIREAIDREIKRRQRLPRAEPD